jgi:predicted phage-related endonuclease
MTAEILESTVVATNTHELTEDALTLIGCSDYGTVMGLNDFGSKVELWTRAYHKIVAARDERLVEMGEFGRISERGTAEILMRKLGRRDALLKPPTRLRYAGRAWARYSLDFVSGAIAGDLLAPTSLTGQTRAMIECKLRDWKTFYSQGWGKPGTDKVPLEIALQVQGQFEAVRADRDFWVGTDLPDQTEAFVAVRVGAYQLYWYKIVRDDDVGRMAVERCERFFVDHVLTGIAPAYDGSDAAGDWLRRKHPANLEVDKTVHEATPEETGLVAKFAVLREQHKQLVKTKEQAEQDLCEAIGDRFGIAGDDFQFTWPSRRGKVSDTKVVAELAKRYGVPEAEIEKLREDNRGEAFRVVDLRLDVK